MHTASASFESKHSDFFVHHTHEAISRQLPQSVRLKQSEVLYVVAPLVRECSARATVVAIVEDVEDGVDRRDGASEAPDKPPSFIAPVLIVKVPTYRD